MKSIKLTGSVRLTFVGDISLNNRYCNINQTNNPFIDVLDEFEATDLLIGNLECLVESEHGENMLKEPRLKTTSKALDTFLSILPFNIVSLAHNHIFDNLLDGYHQTIEKLEANSVAHLGSGTTKEASIRPLEQNVNGLRFAFKNYVSRDTNPNIPKGAPLEVNYFSLEKAVNDINILKSSADYIIILLHWGGDVEGGNYPHYNQQKIAHRLIDSGANIIIGHHSHTFQPFEKYNAGLIFYSLGNFCFDDVQGTHRIFEMDWDKNAKSAIVHIDFWNNFFSENIVPIENNNLKIVKNPKLIKKYLLRNKYFHILFFSKIIWSLYYMKYKYFDPVRFFLSGNDRSFFKQLRKINLNLLTIYFKK